MTRWTSYNQANNRCLNSVMGDQDLPIELGLLHRPLEEHPTKLILGDQVLIILDVKTTGQCSMKCSGQLRLTYPLYSGHIQNITEHIK